MRAHLTLPLATLATLAGATQNGTAHADCPTSIRDLPPTGLLASATRTILADTGNPVAAAPTLEADIGVAGGMRAETSATVDDLAPTGALGGQVLVRRKGMTGCASGDLVDVREGAVHATASAQLPILFTGISFGAEVDRNVRLPLATRAEFLRAPLSRFAAHISLSFIDLELADGANHLRILAVPFSVENELTAQDGTSTSLDRHVQRLDVAMFRFVASEPTGSADIGIFNFNTDWLVGERAEMLPVNGFVRISPLSLAVTRDAYSFELDGGLLSTAGLADCETTRCTRGFYVGALRRTHDQLAFDLRGERSAFIGVDDMPAVEDRLTASTTLSDAKRSGTLGGFIAASQPFAGDDVTRYAGMRLSLAHKLPSDLTATVDGELVTASASSPDAQARVLASVAWRRSTKR